MYTVGSVPYLNARPLVRHFENPQCEIPVRVVYDVPSKLPALLESGEADAVLASSIEALTAPGRRVAGGLCIASDGPVLSVRLFSKVPPSKIERLALDQSSMTSNALAQIVLAELHGARPSAQPEPPDLERMLDSYDACVLIGDIGMRTDGAGLHVLDLGEEWKRLTGLPFVWALWIGGERLTAELSGYLNQARKRSSMGAGAKRLGAEEEVCAVARESGWSEPDVRKYLLEAIVFDLGERELAGLREFQRRLLTAGIREARHFPQIVEPLPDPVCA